MKTIVQERFSEGPAHKSSYNCGPKDADWLHLELETYHGRAIHGDTGFVVLHCAKISERTEPGNVWQGQRHCVKLRRGGLQGDVCLKI